MITVTCIKKFYKNNTIYGYRLQDQQNNIKDATSKQLKQAIRNKLITVSNLTLTSDNRLIDTSEKQHKPQQKSEEQKIKEYIAKAKLLGLQKEIPTACGHHCILVSKSETEHIIYIPDNVVELNTLDKFCPFTEKIQKLRGIIKIIGGINLKSSRNMFWYCGNDLIDLSYFNTTNIKDMSGMFGYCYVNSINFSSFDTHNVTEMQDMFCYCQAKSLNLQSFDTSKVTNMRSMFCECEAQFLDLSSFDTHNVIDMGDMFKGCQAKLINLSSFSANKILNTDCMFHGCRAEIKVTDQKFLEAYNR